MKLLLALLIIVCLVGVCYAEDKDKDKPIVLAKNDLMLLGIGGMGGSVATWFVLLPSSTDKVLMPSALDKVKLPGH
jgi:hypothetical protein